MSAALIFDIAPLGALVAYSDGAPRPPARFTKKLAAWERRNGTGRLVRKEPARERPTYTCPPCFTLHEGTFGQNGIILVSVMRTYGIDSDLRFASSNVPALARSACCNPSATVKNCCISPKAATRPSCGWRETAITRPASTR